MTNKEAYDLQNLVRQESPELCAVYCLRTSKGPIGARLWRVDGNDTQTGEVFRFRTTDDYSDYKKGRL